jgi:hypothetical protein
MVSGKDSSVSGSWAVVNSGSSSYLPCSLVSLYGFSLGSCTLEE